MKKINIPEVLKTSDQTEKLSRTIKGLAVVVVMVIVRYTPLTEMEAVELINIGLACLGSVYALYGVGRKFYNKYKK